MSSLENLLRQANDTPTLSEEFVPNVMRLIEQRESVSVSKSVWWSVVVGALGFVGMYVVSSLAISVLQGTLPDLLVVLQEEPALLKAPEMWLAIRENLPAGMLVNAVILCGAFVWTVRRLLRALPSISFFHHAFAY